MQYVYVLNNHGEPLMPCSPRKARILLKTKRATVKKRTPFTIQLIYGSTGYKQPITLGVDAGSKHIGLSASTESKEIYAEELKPRNDVVDLLSARRELRRGRRNRKTRYRARRFNNRVHSKHKGWLAPSVEVKIQEHITAIKRICRRLPIGIMRKTLIARLRSELSIPVSETYGYITKMRREQHDIPKSHTNDALCIANHPKAEHCGTQYNSKAVRHHNRQIHKCKINKGGTRKRNQAPYFVKGFRLWDKVSFKGEECFITGRRSSGSFMLKKLDGTTISNGTGYKRLKFLEPANDYLLERCAR